MGSTLNSYGIALFILGILLLAYLLKRVYRRIRFQDTGDPKSKAPRAAKYYLIALAVIFLILSQILFWISSQVKYFRPLGTDRSFSYLNIDKTGDPIKSLNMKFYPMSGDSLGMENLFYLSGDSWRLRGEILVFKFANKYLGLPDTCYKVVEFNGRFLGRLPPDTKGALLHTEIIEGGESDINRFFSRTTIFRWFAEADSFSTDFERVDSSVGFYMYLKSDGTVVLR